MLLLHYVDESIIAHRLRIVDPSPRPTSIIATDMVHSLSDSTPNGCHLSTINAVHSQPSREGIADWVALRIVLLSENYVSPHRVREIREGVANLAPQQVISQVRASSGKRNDSSVCLWYVCHVIPLRRYGSGVKPAHNMVGFNDTRRPVSIGQD